ncbi:MAG: FAD-dependent monooxygenase [Halieaceae bacterium]|nr:FAD-dependent monooxygenase [Halieaceae bacterium]
MVEERDIVIIVAGMVGMSLALLLRAQLSETIGVTLLEGNDLSIPADFQDTYPAFDSRTTALSYSSRRIFENIGIWELFENNTSLINSIHVSSKGRFGSALLTSNDYDLPALGYVAENLALGSVLLRSISDSSEIELLGSAKVLNVKSIGKAGVSLKINQEGLVKKFKTKLLIVADGAKSKIRESFAIDSTIKDYRQDAIVTNVEFERPHMDCAFERFTESGPLAVLPLLGTPSQPNRCSVVWSTNPERAKKLENISLGKFKILLQKEFGYRLGRISDSGERSRFPLSLIKANEQVRQGIVIMGNAAHALHPVAGQGFNLALRDAHELARILSNAVSQDESLGDLKVLESYRLARLRDQEIIVTASDILPRLFTYRNHFVGLARSIALASLDILPPIKNRLVRHAAGMSF